MTSETPGPEQVMDRYPEIHALVIDIGPRPENSDLLKQRVSSAVQYLLRLIENLGIHKPGSLQLMPDFDSSPLVMEVHREHDENGFVKIILPDVHAYIDFVHELAKSEPAFPIDAVDFSEAFIRTRDSLASVNYGH